MMSMVSLTMMARLLEAVRASARLVLVGDPDQLSSVAGAVLADIALRADRRDLGGN
jgi:exodeoxyribonuclease V alpha subunit